MSDSVFETTASTGASSSSITSTTATTSTSQSSSATGTTTTTDSNLLGSLTTTFTAPTQCTQAYFYPDVFDAVFFTGWQGQACFNGGGINTFTQDGDCLPPVTVSTTIESSSSSSLLFSTVVPQSSGYYSPGIACPAGYTTACGASVGSDGVSSAVSGLQSLSFVYTATAGETVVGCCPTGYQCMIAYSEDYGSQQRCEKVVVSTTLVLETCTNGTDGYSASPTQVIVPLTTTESGSDTTTAFSVTAFTLYNSLVQMNYQATDLPSTSSSASSSASTTTEANSTSSSSVTNGSGSSNHKTTTIAVAVVVPCVALLIAAALAWFWRRRRNKNRQVASYEATQTTEASGVAGPLELDSKVNNKPAEVAADQTRFEVAGSTPQYEMAGTDPNTVVHEMYGDVPR